jgi:hypothetical protein
MELYYLELSQQLPNPLRRPSREITWRGVAGLHKGDFEKGTSARFQYPENFPDGLAGIDDVLKHAGAHDGLHGVVFERQIDSVRLNIDLGICRQVEIHGRNAVAAGGGPNIQSQPAGRPGLFPEQELGSAAAAAMRLPGWVPKGQLFEHVHAALPVTSTA